MRFAIASALLGGVFCSVVSLPVSADDGAGEWSGTLGGGVGVEPKYSGAKENKVSVLPLIKLQYGAFFLGAVDDITAVGWNALETDHWTFSTGVGANLFPRQASDDQHLRGLGDIDITPRGFISARYQNEAIEAGAVITQDIGGDHQGFKLTTFARWQWKPTEDLRLFTGPTLSWADGDYMQTHYGISATQAGNSGLPRYSAASGLEKYGVEAGINYQLNASWMTGARVSLERLAGDAADSPLTQRENQLNYGVFIGWQF